MKVDKSTVVDAVYNAGLDESMLRGDYSGRGMYGDKCLALVGDLADLVAFAVALGDENEWVKDVSSDGMGMSSVFYWRGVQVDGLDSEDEDE